MKLKIVAEDQKTEIRIPNEEEIQTIDFQAKSPSVDKKDFLSQTMIKEKGSSFYIRVKGTAVGFPNINDGDLLLVNKSAVPENNNLVIAVVDGDFILKRIGKFENRMYLLSGTSEKAVEITDTMNFTLWGVVNYIIHKV